MKTLNSPEQQNCKVKYLSIILLSLFSLANSADASFWGPPSCDDGSIVDELKSQIQDFHDVSIKSAGTNPAGMLIKQIHLQHISKIFVDIVSIRDIQSDDKTRMCSLDAHTYFDEKEGKDTLDAISKNEILAPSIKLLQSNGNVQIQALFDMYQDGIYNTISYEVYYDTSGNPSFNVLEFK